MKFDSAYKFRRLNNNQVAYHGMDEKKKKKSNQIKLLHFSFSDISSNVLYTEHEGKIEDFLVQEGELLILSKALKDEGKDDLVRTLKILAIKGN